MKKTVLSPAKVNLYLKVISKRPDGYHDIRSVVDIVSICDTIHIEDIEGDGIMIEDDKGVLPSGEANTIFRAVRALRETAGINRGVRIFVEKNIPIGSGLGGPSTNAATVLKELRDHWGLSLSDDELRRIGSGIGADVPLFLYGRPCIMEGIGEIITPINLPKMWYVIVYPDVAISTKAVYEGLKIVLTNKQNDIKLRGNFKKTGDVASILENDLEQVGMTMCPQVGEIKARLKEAKAAGSLMSGSGSSVFGIFEREEDAWQASYSLHDMGVVFVAYSL